MASEETPSSSEECEKLMLKVIETRKLYGKQCLEYKRKSLQCELSLLTLRLNRVTKLKPPLRKYEIPNMPYKEMTQELDDFKNEIAENEKRLKLLMKKVKTTEDVAIHIKRDRINKLAKKPFTTNTFLLATESKPQEGS